MKIHEYQAQSLLAQFGIPVLPGEVATSAAEARAAYEKLGCEKVVVKCQIHAGGRGKGTVKEKASAGKGREVLQGGVHLAASADEVAELAGKMLGNVLVTHQTGPDGQPVGKVFICQAAPRIDTELYVGLAIDRQAGVPVLMASSEGGVEIEQVAKDTPEKIFKEQVDPALGLAAFQARRLAYRLGLGKYGKETHAQGADVMMKLARLLLECDASLAEINPLVVTSGGDVIALDAKVSFDDNSLFRHPDFAAWHDPSMEDPRETAARKLRLSYVGLDGEIGCLVNGAGLAMATMDIIKHYGSEPANFLDVGGSATREMVTEAFKIIMPDRRVRAILVNIFAGIAQCDTIAEGVLSAVREVDLQDPLVVRLEGTRSKEGRAIMDASDLKIISASSMDDAAKKVIAAAQAGQEKKGR